MQCMAARSFGKKFEPWKVGERVWLSAKNLISALFQRSLPLNDMAPSQSKLSFPLSHSRSNFPPLGNHIPSSMLLSYCPIKKQKSMVQTTLNPPHPPLPPDIINGQEEYKIKAILAHKGNVKGKHRFLVSWKGYPSSDNSWIPEKEMNNAQEILKTYKERL